ncbi:MAG: ABC transporter permease [Bryobacter sp.]|nr:ABC transporter permease [Bryobacter sp.]
MFLAEALRFSYQALTANKLRTFLTALGLVIGNASVILVVTISLTSRDYILAQISSIGSNMIYAYYEAGSNNANISDADFIKIADLEAVRRQLGSDIVAATGVIPSFDRMYVDGREQDVSIIGTDEYYAPTRNLQLLAGRFLDPTDVSLRGKVALLTQRMAKRMYGSEAAAVGQSIKIYKLQFSVIGVFKERVSSFGLSEITDETMLIPITVSRYFSPVERIDPLYVQVRSAADVTRLTESVRQIVESRHRAGARYRVESLAAILETAEQIALVLTIVLILIAAIALLISGIGIMNIMLVTVTERTKEIGVRMAIGASPSEILRQFLIEATLISLAGGIAGILLGVAMPLSVQLFVDGIRIPISTTSIVVALGVSVVVGLIFGTLPARRASRLNPTEALRYE